MRAKSGLHTSKGKRNADTSQQKAVGEKQQKPPPGPTGEAGAETGAATVSRGPNASQQADVVAGTRVRLRDSGRLGTVVGKKAGGWWIVDLAESWGAVAGDVGGVPSAGMNRTLSSVSSSSPITTRRVNMEPLGKAYAAPSSDASGAVRKAPAVSGAAAGVALPSILRGQTISLDTMATAGAKVAEPIMIRTLSGDGLEHAGMKEWLVFSDLHVGPGTLNVSLEVLDRVNEEAMKRSACGIAFLGDFWHSRGSLKVDLLVPVMERLATWTRPVVMIPGNHDQVTLGGGMHSLTPLQFAFANSTQALVLSEPTVFLGALWIPHIRNNTAMEAVLSSDEARNARVIFCHVDITGASMNDGVSSHAGIPRSAFPSNVSTFSGHFHKPHTVGDGFIRYVGSPYQTCLSESGQSKALLVLDADTWAEKEAIPLSIGRRFFRVRGDDEPLPTVEEVLPGDRVVWTVTDAGSDSVRRRAEVLLKERVEVELRESPRPFPTTSTSGQGLGDGHGGDYMTTLVNSTSKATRVSWVPDSANLSPDALFRKYLERERGGGRIVSEEVERLGFKLIGDLGEAPLKENRQDSRYTFLELHSIQLKNFGPFRDEVTYPLDDRGVVLLRGANLDDSGADSNGSGKTTLAMSALWALAGAVDARPVSDGRVADVVHEASRALSAAVAVSSSNDPSSDKSQGAAKRSTVAEATLTGTLNGKPLWVKRRKGARVNQLFLKYDGEDLTRQIAKETQTVLEEDLGISPHVLMRGIFQGQHHMNGLLESTDAQLKEELALLVPMEMWQELASRSRATARKCDDNAARFRERAVTRREDLAQLTEDLERARRELENRTADRFLHSSSSSSSYSARPILVDPAANNSTAELQDVIITEEGETAVGISSSLSLSAAATAASATTTLTTVGEQALLGHDCSNRSANSAVGVPSGVNDGGPEGTERARREAREARIDAEAADEALRVLRKQVEGLTQEWTQRSMRVLGEAKAAQERKVFIRRDEEKASARYRESDAAVARLKQETVVLRERSPEMWGTLQERYQDAAASTASTAEEKKNGQGESLPVELLVEVKEAEAKAESSRAALADARAALNHASEAMRGHQGLEMTGEGECHTCGQPVTGRLVKERGEILAVDASAAADAVARRERVAAVHERMLESSRSNTDTWKDMSRAFERMVEATRRVRDSASELEARRAELRLAEQEVACTEGKVAALKQRETLLRREWAGKTKAAEWALKAYRDKQILADHELTEAVAREAERKLQHQKRQAEWQRMLHAEELAWARVKEIEAAADRIRAELAEVEEKECETSALKSTSTALAEHLGVRGVQNFVFRDAVNQLQANTGRYLDVLSDGALQLHLSMDGERVVKRATARAADGTFRDRSLSQLSGGQWRRSSLALELAFAELARQRSRFCCNILVLDEVLSQLDSYGRARVAAMLRALTHGRTTDDEQSGLAGPQAIYSTILVILQDLPAEELQESFDRIDQVVKHRDCSSVIVDD